VLIWIQALWDMTQYRFVNTGYFYSFPEYGSFIALKNTHPPTNLFTTDALSEPMKKNTL
jgi:hypothetical protein